MTQESAKPEDRIKAAVIDRLVDACHVDADSVLISEMTVADWSRRADVVLANGHLWGFEVKSEADNLTRLPGQIDTFRRHFEKLVVVSAKRFEAAVGSMIPPGVGLWIEDNGEIKQKVAPRCFKLTKQAYLSLMTATEIASLLSCNGLKVKKGTTRLQLVESAEKLPLTDLAGSARAAIKRRYRGRHAEFIGIRDTIGTLAAMPRLKRPRSLVIATGSERPVQTLTDEACDEVSSDHPQFMWAPGGPVLRRKTS
ncbi:sce7726 family protein [Aureimonas sp. AU4]|uniref:sce7726 family protein n=1 Tax=Aureimonas sp. AU4 TaxID=1638163 RepID=UPI000706C5C6|nr:sce7726 family protein [Aureimonas sp. AU4]BAT30618.1 putative phage-related protein, protein cII [Aureimonas sp. AU4]